MIERQLQQLVKERLFSGKAVVLTGPRQVGKTTLIHTILEDKEYTVRFLDGDDPTVRRLLDEPNTEQIKQLIGDAEIVFIDEAQRMGTIGLTAKIITDQFPEKQLILSGSSAFELNSSIQEPLTGRKWSFNLFPISWKEWQDHVGYLKSEQDLENRLVFGFYPDVLNNSDHQSEVLDELVESYLYKDILNYAGIRKPEVIQKVVQAISYQVGQEVVYKEVGDLVGLDPKTVASYIDILEKAYVVIRLPAYSRNLRNEIKKNQKIYFYDNGVRNAVIHDYGVFATRTDKGALWENFLISERLKQLRYAKNKSDMYFWRTKQHQEVDYVEVSGKVISGFEFKWNPKRSIRFPKTFTKNYSEDVKGINRDNFREFVLPDF
ncbi:ATP-binding protein [Gracilimonas sp.]|uniref:ATP-binding protein n=1 Tax=Gracilimonas TaxID=649462 RepID=UPI0025BDC5CB|nr:ATP-binding protein [Gracilimonas sp.]